VEGGGRSWREVEGGGGRWRVVEGGGGRHNAGLVEVCTLQLLGIGVVWV